MECSTLKIDVNKVLSRKEVVLLAFTGISLPLITLRVELPFLSMSLFHICCGLLLLFNMKHTFKKIVVSRSDMLIHLFLIITLMSILYSENVRYGLTQWVKLLFVVVFFVLLRTLFVNKPLYIDFIMRYASVSLGFYLMYLTWIYIVKFGQTYIGIETSYATRTGKNSLAFMVSFVFPFILVNFAHLAQEKKWRLRDLFIVLMTTIGALLIQSRALFLLMVLYFLFLVFSLKISWGLVKTGLIIFILLSFIFCLVAPLHVVSDLTTRFSSLMLLLDDEFFVQSSGVVAGLGSLESRRYLIGKGLYMFSEKPLFGNGLGSFRYFGGVSSAVSHNDYIQVAAEQGFVGLVVFISLIGTYLWTAFKVYRTNNENMWLLLAMVGVSFYFLMINAYDNVIFWTLLSIIGSKRYKKKQSRGRSWY